MTKGIFRSGLFTLLSLVLAAGVAHSQVQCTRFYCTASAYYSGGSVNGYVQYFDFDVGLYLWVSANVSTPDNYDIPIDSEFSWDTVTANVENLAPNPNGDYSIFGYAAYDDAYAGWTYDGAASADVWVVFDPTWETTFPDGASTNGDGEVFVNYLQPSSYDFDGFWVTETFGLTSDTCYANYRANDGSIYVTGPSQKQGLVSGNNYTDDIWAPPDWVTFYQGQLAGTSNSCGWSTGQTVYYSGDQFDALSIGVNVTATNYYTNRGGCTVPASGGSSGCS